MVSLLLLGFPLATATAAELVPGSELQTRIRKAADAALKALSEPDGDLEVKIAADTMGLITATAMQALATDPIRTAETNLGETTRTDRQVFASSTAGGSTKLVQTAGVPDLLGIAIENGAIRQETRGTNLVLSTTPYAFIAWAEGGDTQQNYDRYGLWRRLGVSATFDMSETSAEISNGVDTQNVSQVGARLRVLGDRSTRTAAFLKLWDEEIAGKVQRYLNVFSESADVILSSDANLDALMEGGTHGELADQLAARVIGQYKAVRIAGNPVTRAELEEAIRQVLQQRVYTPIMEGRLLADEAVREKVRSELEPKLRSARAALSTMKQDVESLTEKYNRSQHLLTIDYRLNRVVAGSDFSEITLVYQSMPVPIDFSLNAIVSLNHSPDGTVAQETVREYGGSASAGFDFDSPLEGFLTPADLQPVNLVLGGKYTYMPDINAGIGSFQVRIALPVMAGVTMPISFNWSSRTETNTDDEFVVTLGGGVNLDALLASVRTKGIVGALVALTD